MERKSHFVNISDGLRRSVVEQPLDDPIEVPNHVSHEDLYKVQVLHARQIHQIQQRLISIETSPIVLSNFQKAVLTIFLAGCAWVLNTTHHNSVGLSSVLATLSEIDKKVSELPAEREIEHRLQAIEELHPRTEK